MRWTCARCGAAVSVALSECPFCPPLPASEADEGAPLPLAAPPERDETGTPATSVAGGLAPPAARPRALRAREEESPYWRGAKMGAGFVLAVVSLLFLLMVLRVWLPAESGWKAWLERLWP